MAVLIVVVANNELYAREQQAPPARLSRQFGADASDAAYNTQRFLLSPEVVIDPSDGTMRLAHSVLVADEMGATDFHQTETLTAETFAKKVFTLDSAAVSGAELFIFGGAEHIRVNGKPLGKSEKLMSTGWTRARIPAALLKKGANEVVLSGGGSLLFEPGRQPGRSFKSSDAGRTWSEQRLGKNDNQQGEYLVRLRLGRYAARGWAMSPVFDLWANRSGQIATPGRLVSIQGLSSLQSAQPEGTSLSAWLRSGSTPTPNDKTWTNWLPLDKEYRPVQAAEGHRWAQVKFELTTSRPQATPRLPARFQLTFDFRAQRPADKDELSLEQPASRAGVRLSPVPFVYQEPSPRLKLLRERYRLDKVIAPGQTEMEELMLLRHWVRNQWHTAWGADSASWMPPWDALMILESKDQPDCLTMCTHYAAVFTQCCLALGWNARHCILDHHCVAEVWVDQHRKWVMMDAGNSKERPDVTLHFEGRGVPLSALELHLARRDQQSKDITVCFTPAKLMAKISGLCRPAPPASGKAGPRPDKIPLADLPKYPVCQLENYRRYAFPGRNNYLGTLFPGELYQGWSEYFYDGYWWVGDSPDEPTISPEYSRQLSPARPRDIDWSLNWTRIHLARTGTAGELQVDVETLTPNLARLEQSADGDKRWKPTPAAFIWRLHAGENRLRIRSVNHFERPGGEQTVRVKWAPAAH